MHSNNYVLISNISTINCYINIYRILDNQVRLIYRLIISSSMTVSNNFYNDRNVYKFIIYDL